MTRAEQFARKIYTSWSEDGMSRKDNTDVIEACIKGYEQAEKDLALTAEDIRHIIKIHYDIVFHETSEIKCGDVADEVLKRFNEQRNGR